MKSELSILVADDDADDLELVQQALEALSPDVTVFTARNGQEALVFLFDLAQALPDIIILDLRMPRLDGKKCLKAIRNDPRLAGIPVVIYTTSQDVDESVELREQGVLHFISKPSNPDEVYYLLSVAVEECWRDLSIRESQESVTSINAG